MGSVIVVIKQPFVQIFLEFIQVAIELFAERDLIELLQNGLVETFTNPVGLRMPGLGFGVVDVVDRQIQLIIMLFDLTAIFGAPIRQDTQHGQSVGLIERQHFVIQHIRCRDRCFGGVQFAVRHFAVSVHVSLLVNTPHAFEVADVEGVLRPQVTRVGGFDFAAGFVILLLFLQGRNLRVAQNQAFKGHFGLQSLEPFFKVLQIMP